MLHSIFDASINLSSDGSLLSKVQQPRISDIGESILVPLLFTHVLFFDVGIFKYIK